MEAERSPKMAMKAGLDRAWNEFDKQFEHVRVCEEKFLQTIHGIRDGTLVIEEVNPNIAPSSLAGENTSPNYSIQASSMAELALHPGRKTVHRIVNNGSYLLTQELKSRKCDRNLARDAESAKVRGISVLLLRWVVR